MCCIPCGPRHSYRPSSRKRTKLTKKVVEGIILNEEYEDCLYKMGYEEEYHAYDGCTPNLLMILNDLFTEVKVARRRTKEYDENYKTIVMIAPCFPARFIFRTEKDD